ncbi:hypothetical protein U91I_01469 [alpha proteobacterium U9-1i]|nr:hypothetical protein U91I_01469 [alpha proteobacterium U9-1i]
MCSHMLNFWVGTGALISRRWGLNIFDIMRERPAAVGRGF